MRRFSDEECAEVIGLYREGRTCRFICDSLGINIQQLQYIRKRMGEPRRYGISEERTGGRPRSATCSSCGEAPNERGGKCLPCLKRYQRDRHYYRKYGIRIEDYERLLEQQDGKCALCESPYPNGNSRYFSVDHCHSSGRVRGLLCFPCNSVLGRLGDSHESVERILQYLRGDDRRTGAV